MAAISARGLSGRPQAISSHPEAADCRDGCRQCTMANTGTGTFLPQQQTPKRYSSDGNTYSAPPQINECPRIQQMIGCARHGYPPDCRLNACWRLTGQIPSEFVAFRLVHGGSGGAEASHGVVVVGRTASAACLMREVWEQRASLLISAKYRYHHYSCPLKNLVPRDRELFSSSYHVRPRARFKLPDTPSGPMRRPTCMARILSRFPRGYRSKSGNGSDVARGKGEEMS